MDIASNSGLPLESDNEDLDVNSSLDLDIIHSSSSTSIS